MFAVRVDKEILSWLWKNSKYDADFFFFLFYFIS